MIAKISEIQSSLKETLSPHRYQHSLSTALLACSLCGRENIDPVRGYLCGLLHDCAREWPEEKLQKWALQKGLDTRISPVLHHGDASAWVASDQFGIDDTEILLAIRHHTFGHPDFGTLGKILFISDYCEYERSHITEVERQELLKLPLNEMVLFVIKHAQEKFTKSPDSVTMDFYKALERG